MSLASHLVRLLRWFTALVALALIAAAVWLLYEAMFILERFGLMAILLALALFSAATILWWILAEGDIPRTRARIRHIASGALLLAAAGVIHAIMSSDRLEAGLYSGLSLLTASTAWHVCDLTNRSSQPLAGVQPSFTL